MVAESAQSDPDRKPISLSRSRNMAAIRGRDTTPELEVRRILHRLGLRFRLHRRDLPGTPDIVLPRFQTVIFVHGCFWHRHPECRFTTNPKTRRDYWEAKFSQNIERDKRNYNALGNAAWNNILVWECELRDKVALEARLLQCVRARDYPVDLTWTPATGPG